MVAESQAFASRECRPGRSRSRCSFSARVHSFAVIRNVLTGCRARKEDDNSTTGSKQRYQLRQYQI